MERRRELNALIRLLRRTAEELECWKLVNVVKGKHA
jgi:hypothetical protein